MFEQDLQGSLAAEVSRHHSVALIEKNVIGRIHKAWYILELDSFTADDEVVLNRITKGTIRLIDGLQSYDFTQPMREGESCAAIDETRVMDTWLATAEGKGRKLYPNTGYLDFE